MSRRPLETHAPSGDAATGRRKNADAPDDDRLAGDGSPGSRRAGDRPAGPDIPAAIHPPIRDNRDLLSFRLSRVTATNNAIAHRLIRDRFALNHADWRLLSVIVAMAPVSLNVAIGPISMNRTQASKILAALVQRGLVRSMTDPDDRRRARLCPTEAGKALHDRVLEFALQRNNVMLGLMTPEEGAMLSAIIDKLQPRLDQILAQLEKGLPDD